VRNGAITGQLHIAVVTMITMMTGLMVMAIDMNVVVIRRPSMTMLVNNAAGRRTKQGYESH
jgi:hypothetical protein